MSFHYPVTLDVTGQRCTIAGGGQVAARKAAKLLQAGAKLQVISPLLCEELAQAAREGQLQWVPRSCREEDLPGNLLVIAATDQRTVNAWIAQYCREQNILVNVAASPRESSFIVNVAVIRGDLVLSVATNGQNPALAQKIRIDLERAYGPAYAEVLRVFNEARSLLKGQVAETVKREKLMKELLDSDIIELVVAGEVQLAREKVQACISASVG